MSRASGLAYPIAVGLAEGGWITVLYLLVDALSRVPSSLGLVVFGLVHSPAQPARLKDDIDSTSRVAGRISARPRPQKSAGAPGSAR